MIRRLGLLMAVLSCFAWPGDTSAFAATPLHFTANELCKVLLPCRPPARFATGMFLEPPQIERMQLNRLQYECTQGERIVAKPGMPGFAKIQHALGLYGGQETIMGCALLTSDSCIVHVPSDIEVRIPMLYRLILDHELGHCRGWVHPVY